MKILIIEDDLRVAELLKRGLEEQGYMVFVTHDGASGLQLGREVSIDLVITDVMMPEIDGLELCTQLKEIKPVLPILILTALGKTDQKLEGFDAGADDYLVKPFEMRELIARVKAILKRATQPKQYAGVLAYAGLVLNLDTKEVTRDGQSIHLTPKEFGLLTYMLQNRERVLSRSEIAEKVWDTHFDTGTNFIDVYINYLRKKIDRGFEPKLIHTKSGMGFILRHEG
jgi:two-component system, OmpR family, copper resistance phosphate regulon response regulator CusR